jgi:hypothetical protein
MSITVFTFYLCFISCCTKLAELLCTLGDESFSSIIYTAQALSKFYGQLHWQFTIVGRISLTWDHHAFGQELPSYIMYHVAL